MAFSSIPEEKRGRVIEYCYWPLLRICRALEIPIAIEASGYTLETINALDSTWIAELRNLLASERAEFIGCGYAQMIGPVVPSRVNIENLRIGAEVYRDLLGIAPKIALVNEQAYSAGLVPLYIDAGYEAIIMEWDNAARSHPDWDPHWRYFPQRAVGPSGETIPVIWNKSIAFQKFQRYAHGEMTLSQYFDYLTKHSSATDGAFPLYGNDAECFDFRPGRFMTEAPLQGEGEWARIETLYDYLKQDSRFHFIRPSDTLRLLDQPLAGNELQLQSASQPIPVKKQDKYNPLRWTVTGRDDIGINTACWQLYEAVSASTEAKNADWQELCYLWSSDFRTHITESRWNEYVARLERFRMKWPLPTAAERKMSAQGFGPGPQIIRDGRFLRIAGQRIDVTLNESRGLVIDKFIDREVSAKALIGTIDHGYYDDIQWGADFYTGHIVFEAPGKPKATDLSPVKAETTWDGQVLTIAGDVDTGIGKVRKVWTVNDVEGTLTLEQEFMLPAPAMGSLRAGHITLNPEAFDRESLRFITHNGGKQPETFFVGDAEISHGRPVSFLVSANQVLGLTGGMIEIGDEHRSVRIETDPTASALVGLINSHRIKDSYFFRLTLSAKELDDTSKPGPDKPIRMVIRISAQNHLKEKEHGQQYSKR